MSNLLNNGKTRKKLLERGPKIVPAQEFKLEEVTEVTKETEIPTETEAKAGAPTPVKEQPKTKPKPATKSAPAKKTKKSNLVTQITSVRVTKATRNKLNALIQLGKADSADVLLDQLLDEYIEQHLLKDEKKTFTLLFEVIQKRDR